MRLRLVLGLVVLTLAACSDGDRRDSPPTPAPPAVSSPADDIDVPRGPLLPAPDPTEAVDPPERRVPAYLHVVTASAGAASPAPQPAAGPAPVGGPSRQADSEVLGPTQRFLAQTQPDAMVVALPVHNEPGVRQLLERLAPRLRSGDIVIVVSGNNNHTLDIPWLNAQAERIQAALANVRLVAMTAGLGNVQQLAPQLSPLFTGIVYDYEPNYPNEPSFTWDFGATMDHVRALRTAVESRGLTAIALPTGRPLLQRSLEPHGWDYGALTQAGGVAFVQTQTYCKKGLPAFEQALDRLRDQHIAGGEWLPQVTVAPNQPNGVSIQQGEACAQAIRARGLPGLMLWWSPAYVGEADEFLRRLGR
ncbi:MAG: hypothetical protein GEU80_09420 [Dehalococcoidia bacterium]|nr:hypothetical protein [Dehalococcoidia bacterium]